MQHAFSIDRHGEIGLYFSYLSSSANFHCLTITALRCHGSFRHALRTVYSHKKIRPQTARIKSRSGERAGTFEFCVSRRLSLHTTKETRKKDGAQMVGSPAYSLPWSHQSTLAIDCSFALSHFQIGGCVTRAEQ
jgi:hypothetical protein